MGLAELNSSECVGKLANAPVYIRAVVVGKGKLEVSLRSAVQRCDEAYDFDDLLSTIEGLPAGLCEDAETRERPRVALLREPTSGRVLLSLSLHGHGRVIPVERRMLQSFARQCSGMEHEVCAWVPTLLELLLDPRSPARDRLASFLTDLLLGGDHSRALPYVAYVSMTANVPEMLGVITHREEMWRLLDDRDPSLRAAAAQLLALPYQGFHGHRRFAARLRDEPDEVVRASLVMATAVSGWMLAPGERASADLEPWLAASHPLVRIAAALALVILEGVDAPSEAVQVLRATLERPPDPEPAWPWGHGDVRSLAERTMPTAHLARR